MPSKYTVALSLDFETNALWEGLPKGERSKRVREALINASIVAERDMLIEALRAQTLNYVSHIKNLKRELMNLEAFGVKE